MSLVDKSTMNSIGLCKTVHVSQTIHEHSGLVSSMNDTVSLISGMNDFGKFGLQYERYH